MIYLLLVLMSGLMAPVQTAANSRVRYNVGGYPYLSTLISFSVSTVILLLVTAILGNPLLPTNEQFSVTPWWGWFGGVLALCVLTINILLFKAIGQLQAMVFPVLGQLLFSLVIDNYGLFGGNIIPLSPGRISGIVIVICGVIMVTYGKMSGDKGSSESRHRLFWQMLGILAGALMACVGAIYGRLGGIIGSSLQATTVSFIVATTVMFIFCLMSGKLPNTLNAFRVRKPWWMWLGGVIGAITVFFQTTAIPIVGVGMFSILFVFGQMVVSLGMEHNGWMDAPKRPIRPIQIVGITLMIIGIILVRLH